MNLSALKPSSALLQDLALVLADLTPASDVHARALMQGEPTDLPVALDHAATLLRESAMPAIIGLDNLTVEATREVVALAEHARARLLLGNGAAQLQHPVIQTATLGHAHASETILWIGCDPDDAQYPIAAAIAAKRSQHLPGTLGYVLHLRECGLGDVLGKARTATAILPDNIDPRVLGQWHKLAAQVQHAVRLSVLSVPWPKPAGNVRGAAEVVTWQTGLSPLNGGIDFTDGSPRPCSATLPHGTDLIIETSSAAVARQPLPQVRRIAIGPADESAEISFITPNLSVGLAAQIMRFDGIILWLCDDPATAPPDPAVNLLANLRQRMENRP